MWLYKNKEIKTLEDFPKDAFGFVYKITHLPTGKIYIGKKNLQTFRNVKLGKKELIKLKEERKLKKIQGRSPSKKLVIKESDWKTYCGSNKEIIEIRKKGKLEDFKREILLICFNKKLLTYFETKYLFLEEVLENGDKYFNNNILGSFYTEDFNVVK